MYMPYELEVYGYHIYFWLNENNEPIHFHIAKGKPTVNATKVWVLRSGDLLLAHNKSRIPTSDLNKVLRYMRSNTYIIIRDWVVRFGYEKYYA